jgi:hypothetical protein
MRVAWTRSVASGGYEKWSVCEDFKKEELTKIFSELETKE